LPEKRSNPSRYYNSWRQTQHLGRQLAAFISVEVPLGQFVCGDTLPIRKSRQNANVNGNAGLGFRQCRDVAISILWIYRGDVGSDTKGAGVR
tara:strand:+ start:153 stop:428 length:276 start_codon:yes stop_codon:yes gene_type:complete